MTARHESPAERRARQERHRREQREARRSKAERRFFGPEWCREVDEVRWMAQRMGRNSGTQLRLMARKAWLEWKRQEAKGE